MYKYVETYKTFDIYSYTSDITGEVEGYDCVCTGWIMTREQGLLKGLLSPTIQKLKRML